MRPGGKVARAKLTAYLLPEVATGTLMENYWQQAWIAWEWGKAILATLMLTGLGVTAIVAAAYAFFKYLGEKWINQKFAERLEAFKSEQARELERLRHKINGVFDRAKRLHDREFEVLPDIWGKLVDAHAWASGYISPLQTYADVSRLSAEQLDEYLNGTEFTETQKKDVKDAANFLERQTVYNRIADMYRHNDVAIRLRDFAAALRKNGIFVTPDIKADMDAMLKLISDAVFEKQLNMEDQSLPKVRDAYKKFKNEAQDLLNKIETSVAARLWDSTTTEV